MKLFDRRFNFVRIKGQWMNKEKVINCTRTAFVSSNVFVIIVIAARTSKGPKSVLKVVNVLFTLDHEHPFAKYRFRNLRPLHIVPCLTPNDQLRASNCSLRIRPVFKFCTRVKN